MLAQVEYRLRVLAWQKTEDGSKGRNQPKPLDPPALAGEVKREEVVQSAKAKAWAERQERRQSK